MRFVGILGGLMLILCVHSGHLKADEISTMEKEIDNTPTRQILSGPSAYGFIDGAKDMHEADNNFEYEEPEVQKMQYIEVAPIMRASSGRKKYDKRGNIIAFFEEDIKESDVSMTIKLRPDKTPLNRNAGPIMRAQTGPKLVNQ